MKLLFATDGIFPDKVGGMERHAYFLIKHLAEFDIDIDVVEPKGGSEHFSECSNVKEFYIERPRYLFPGHYLYEVYQYSRNICRFIRGKRYDIAYSEGFTLLDYLKRKDFPCIYNPHGLEMFQTRVRYATIFKKFVSYMGKYSDIVISLGGKLTDILLEEANIPSSKIEVIPNGIDIDYIKLFSKSIKKIPNSFLFVGRLAYNKGVDLLARVFNEITDSRLYIIGTGSLKNSLQKSAKGDNVIFLGRVSDEELFEWYSKIECFILPTLGEGMPTAILEAMANGLPIIASDVGAVSTMVNKKNGFLIKPGNKEELVKAVRTFISSGKDEKNKMGKESYKLAKKRFEWAVVAAQTYKVLENTLKGNNQLININEKFYVK